MMNVAVEQGSPEWLEARRSLVTATDIPVLLGLSPYRCEADLADEKRGKAGTESTLRMRLGSYLEDFIAAEYETQTGQKVSRWMGLAIHPTFEWAGASPDRWTEDRLVELKYTDSRRRFADGIPQDIEGQVAWQLFVTGYPVADIAVLSGGEVTVYEQKADPALFGDLVRIAEDFRARLAAGGPFSRDLNRLRKDYPRDNGMEMIADADLSGLVLDLVNTRSERKRLELIEETLEVAVKSRMGPITRLKGDGFSVSWKQTKDREEVDYKSLAEGLLHEKHDDEAAIIRSLYTNVKPGFRPLRVTVDKDE